MYNLFCFLKLYKLRKFKNVKVYKSELMTISMHVIELKSPFLASKSNAPLLQLKQYSGAII